MTQWRTCFWVEEEKEMEKQEVRKEKKKKVEKQEGKKKEKVEKKVKKKEKERASGSQSSPQQPPLRVQTDHILDGEMELNGSKNDVREGGRGEDRQQYRATKAGGKVRKQVDLPARLSAWRCGVVFPFVSAACGRPRCPCMSRVGVESQWTSA